MLRMALTGSPEIALNGVAVTDVVNGKLLALTVYLAVSSRTHTRDALANLLWSEMGSGLARKNLRGSLYELRKLVGPYLVTTRHDTFFDRRLRYWLDVEVLQTHITPELLQANPRGFREVLALYRGEFMAGFHVRNAPVFEEWVDARRRYLHNQVMQGWQMLADHAMKTGDDGLGLEATNHLLELDPAHETGHRQRMLLLVRSGQPKSALAQYELCQQVLANELAITPSPETTALYEQIKAGSHRQTTVPGQLVGQEAAESAGLFHTAAPHRNLLNVPRAHHFHGRTGELARLTTWLTVDGTRLAGVFGLPGQGKTQLVSQWIHSMAQRPGEDVNEKIQHRHTTAEAMPAPAFEHFHWISLTSAGSLPDLVQEWLHHLGVDIPAAAQNTAETMLPLLLQILQQRRCLLVVDNIEETLEPRTHTGLYAQAYQGFGSLLHAITTTPHCSALILIGRVAPPEFSLLEEDFPTARSLALEGLGPETTQQLLRTRGMVGSMPAFQAVHSAYQGHPLAAALAADAALALFNGDGDLFVQTEIPIFDQLRHLFDQQVRHLSPLEKEIVACLSLADYPVPTLALWRQLCQPQSQAQYLEALRSLLRQSLISNLQGTLSLPTVFRRYVRQELEGLPEARLQPAATATPVLFVSQAAH